MYAWRKMPDTERHSVLAHRQLRGGSWRRPPTWNAGCGRSMVTAACYEHLPHIGSSPSRISQFEASLLAELNQHSTCIYAHVILPNHYHVLLESKNILNLKESLGRLHGRVSFEWNKEDNARGRKVFHGSAETLMKPERHFRLKAGLQLLTTLRSHGPPKGRTATSHASTSIGRSLRRRRCRVAGERCWAIRPPG